MWGRWRDKVRQRGSRASLRHPLLKADGCRPSLACPLFRFLTAFSFFFPPASQPCRLVCHQDVLYCSITPSCFPGWLAETNEVGLCQTTKCRSAATSRMLTRFPVTLLRMICIARCRTTRTTTRTTHIDAKKSFPASMHCPPNGPESSD